MIIKLNNPKFLFLFLISGIVRPQLQIKPADDDDTLQLPIGRSPAALPTAETNATQKPSAGTTGNVFFLNLNSIKQTLK